MSTQFSFPPHKPTAPPAVYVVLGGPVNGRGIKDEMPQIRPVDIRYPFPLVVSCTSQEQAEQVCMLQTCFDIAGEIIGPSKDILKHISLELLKSEGREVINVDRAAYPIIRGRYPSVALHWDYCFAETKAKYVSQYTQWPAWIKVPTVQQALIYYITNGGDGAGVIGQLHPAVAKVLATLFAPPRVTDVGFDAASLVAGLEDLNIHADATVPGSAPPSTPRPAPPSTPRPRPTASPSASSRLYSPASSRPRNRHTASVEESWALHSIPIVPEDTDVPTLGPRGDAYLISRGWGVSSRLHIARIYPLCQSCEDFVGRLAEYGAPPGMMENLWREIVGEGTV
ncbi:uncharacterized protein C8Q71DRAFT_911825 [Rhodofomes roseus]|uniref:Uncharacterized protein n=1 Tax=Rhodofomes roseus TaxID=34475 RepID=A0ABQ8JYR5_9APHY|nr:uncharacterized protein C8Q71DRAFT_911825 [Rhodofomes roseus]KAH9829419.1 hypothetical protein C8Q71DRAFT_911825 [Rhodofomes roseus]